MHSSRTLLVSPFALLRKIRHRFDEMLLTQRDAVAMAALAPLSGPFVPITRYSMRPSGILVLVNEIMINRRRCIVECGSGLSTIYMARALRSLKDGGSIISIDHDPSWLDVLHAQLRVEGLEQFIKFVHAPLVAGDWGMGASQWYDPSVVSAAVQSKRIELLLIDGPVASDEARQYARYPAVPLLAEYFSDSLSIIVDDIVRSGERTITNKWCSILGASFEYQPTSGRIGIARIGRTLVT